MKRSSRVLLGVPGDLIDPASAPSVYRTKIGGPPYVLDYFPKSAFEEARCGVCGSQLGLVLQTHAPLVEEQIGGGRAERWIYVFGCVRKGCGKKDSCWKTFRLQRRQDVSSTVSTVMDDDTHGRGNSGIEQKTECLTSMVAGTALSCNSNSSFSLDDLKAALESSSKKKKSRRKPQKKNAVAHLQEKSEMIEWDVELPDFYICAEEEPDPSTKGPLMADPHIQQSIEHYMQAMDTTDGASWQGECYEKPDCEAADGAAFAKFQRRLELCPEQCVRYGFDQEILNPTSGAIKEPVCQLCGSRCVFEMQLMPHLIHALYEAAEWRQPETAASADSRIPLAVQNAFDCSMDWEWATIAVFTCRKSCNGSNLCTAVTENTFMFKEPHKRM